MVVDLADTMPNGTEVLGAEQGNVEATAHGGKTRNGKMPIKNGMVALSLDLPIFSYCSCNRGLQKLQLMQVPFET